MLQPSEKWSGRKKFFEIFGMLYEGMDINSDRYFAILISILQHLRPLKTQNKRILQGVKLLKANFVVSVT